MGEGEAVSAILRSGTADLGGYTPCIEEGWVGGDDYYDEELDEMVHVPPVWDCIRQGEFVRWGYQDFSCTLSHEYTTDDFKNELREAIPHYTEIYQDGPDWNEMRFFNPHEPAGEILISTDARNLSATKVRYRWLSGHVDGTPMIWMETFSPVDDPETPNHDESTDVYPPVIQAWSVDASESPLFEIDPLTRNGGAYGRYSIVALPMRIVPDWDHDQQIGPMDEYRATPKLPFRFWINDDGDSGDISFSGSDIPRGAGQGNAADSAVNGRSDMIDFFPVWLDIHDVLARLSSEGEDVQLALRHAEGAVNIVYTDLERSGAGEYLLADRPVYGPQFNLAAHQAPVHRVEEGGLVLEEAFLRGILDNREKGVLLVEGRLETSQPLVLEIRRGGEIHAAVSMPMNLSSIKQMCWIAYLRGNDSGKTPWLPRNCPAMHTKNVVFVHGFHVSRSEAWGWHAEMFKRFYWSGSQARYHAVFWEGDIGMPTGLHYNENVVNAFATASRLSAYVNSLSGDTVAVAHSLGNMVVASAFRDHGMNAGKHFMLNAAVPAESFDPLAFNDNPADNPMVHEGWIQYEPRTWSANWHRLFEEIPNDDRAKVTWSGHFASSLARVYNFFSSSDEIFELFPNGTPPASQRPLDRYSWHKQELYKGRNPIIGTGWAGWGFNGPMFDRWGVESPWGHELANAMFPEMLREYPVFSPHPRILFKPVIPLPAIQKLLSRAIPALSPAAGLREISLSYTERNVDMNDPGQIKMNGWGRNGAPYDDRWLHSDIKNMAFYFTSNLFKDIVNKGSLK